MGNLQSRVIFCVFFFLCLINHQKNSALNFTMGLVLYMAIAMAMEVSLFLDSLM